MKKRIVIIGNGFASLFFIGAFLKPRFFPFIEGSYIESAVLEPARSNHSTVYAWYFSRGLMISRFFFPSLIFNRASKFL